MRSFSTILALSCLLVVCSACVASHSTPPLNYSTAVDTPIGGSQVPPVRIVFDQRGTLYPRSDAACGFSWPTDAQTKNGKAPLVIVVPEACMAQARAIQEINSRIKAEKPDVVVFQIAGYTESFWTANDDMKLFRWKLLRYSHQKKFLFVEVYWDSLAKDSLLAPAGNWMPAINNSNFAGQFGLRPILNQLPEGTDIAFVTKSRGAAVALSALVNPIYDNNTCISEKEIFGRNVVDPSTPFQKKGTVALVMYAPAVGREHVSDTPWNQPGKVSACLELAGDGQTAYNTASTSLLKESVDYLSMTYDRGDVATAKVIGGDLAELFGSTALNHSRRVAGNAYRALTSDEPNGHKVSVYQGWFITWSWSQLMSYANSHATQDYLALYTAKGLEPNKDKDKHIKEIVDIEYKVKEGETDFKKIANLCMFAIANLVETRPLEGCVSNPGEDRH